MNDQNNLNNMINTNSRFINSNLENSNNNENTTQHSSMLSSPNTIPSNNLDDVTSNNSHIDTSNLDMKPQVDTDNDFIMSSKSIEAMSDNLRPVDESLAFDKKAFIILIIILLLFIYFMPYISKFIEDMNW